MESLDSLKYTCNSAESVVFAKMLHNLVLWLVSEAEAVGLKERSPMG
jgi:hypothetical protein